MMRFGGHGLFSLLLFLVCGALIGGIIGQVLSQVSLSGMIPYLTKTYEIFDFKDIYLNLADAMMVVHGLPGDIAMAFFLQFLPGGELMKKSSLHHYVNKLVI